MKKIFIGFCLTLLNPSVYAASLEELMAMMDEAEDPDRWEISAGAEQVVSHVDDSVDDMVTRFGYAGLRFNWNDEWSSSVSFGNSASDYEFWVQPSLSDPFNFVLLQAESESTYFSGSISYAPQMWDFTISTSQNSGTTDYRTVDNVLRGVSDNHYSEFALSAAYAWTPGNWLLSPRVGLAFSSYETDLAIFRNTGNLGNSESTDSRSFEFSWYSEYLFSYPSWRWSPSLSSGFIRTTADDQFLFSASRQRPSVNTDTQLMLSGGIAMDWNFGLALSLSLARYQGHNESTRVTNVEARWRF